MKLRHRNHCAIASAVLMAAAGCASPDTDGPQAWRIEAVFNVKHAIQSSQGYYTLGRYHDGSKAWGQAVDAYRKAIAIDARNVEAYNALGVALAQSGRHADAETVLRQAVALAPELTHVRSNLGYVLMLAGKPDEAVLELKAAVLQDSGNPTAMANLRDAVGQRDAARNSSATAGASTVTKPVAIAFSNSTETVMVSRTAPVEPVEPVGAMIKVEVPTAAGVSKPVDAGEVPALSTLAVLRVIDQPTIAWGQQPAVVAVPEPVLNPVSFFPLPPVPLTFAAMGRVGTGQQVSKLEVSNGNGTAGMAASVGRWLAAQGLQASSLTDRRPYTQVQTLVQFRNGHEEAAMRVARSLPGGGKALLVPTQGLRADVRVVLGRDWVPTHACLIRNACQPVIASVMPTVVAARSQ